MIIELVVVRRFVGLVVHAKFVSAIHHFQGLEPDDYGQNYPNYKRVIAWFPVVLELGHDSRDQSKDEESGSCKGRKDVDTEEIQLL